MKAAVFRSVGEPLTIEELNIDDPGPHEVAIRTVASGVCHSDLHFVEGHQHTPMPTVLGHEVAGVVEAVGSEVRDVQPGDHVVTCVSAFCGRCRYCVAGRPNLCVAKPKRAVDDAPVLTKGDERVFQFFGISGFAEALLVHERAVVAIDRTMPLDRAALIGCAVLTGLGAVFNTAKVHPGATVVVFGCGGVGLAAIQGAVMAGARRVVAVDVVENKLALARHLGATDLVRGGRASTMPDIAAATGGEVDFTFEAVGHPALIEQALTALAPGGTATVIGMVPAGTKVELLGSALMGDRRIQGCTMGSNRFRSDIPLYVDYYQQGRLNLDDLVTERATLSQVNDAMRAMKAGEVARTVLTFDAQGPPRTAPRHPDTAHNVAQGEGTQ